MDRSSPEYLQLAQEQAIEAGSLLFGIRVDNPPETLEELEGIIDNKECDCFIAQEVEGVMELIRHSAEPDELVRALPFEWVIEPTRITGDLFFILPRLT